MLAGYPNNSNRPSRDGGRPYSACVIGTHSPSLSNPHNRKGLWQQNDLPPDRMLDLRSDEGGTNNPELRPFPLMSQFGNSHGDHDIICEIKAAGGYYSGDTDRAGGLIAWTSLHGSPARSPRTSPIKRPWYPAGRRPSSGEHDRIDHDHGESTHVIDSTLRNLCDERGKQRDEAIVQQIFEGGNRNTSSTEGKRREPDNAHFSTENKRRQSTPMAVEEVGKVSGGGRTLGSHHRRQLSSPTNKTARFRPTFDPTPGDPRANQPSPPLVGNERSSAVRRGSAPRYVPGKSLSATRARVRDLQARGRLSQRSDGITSLAAVEARKGDPESAVFVGHSKQVLSLAHRKDILFSAAADGTAKAWDTYSQKCLATYEGHQSAVWGIEVTDRTLITGSADGSVRFWDIETARCLHVIDLRSAVRDVVVVGGFLAVATSSPGVEVIDLNSMKRHGILEGHLMAVSALTSLRQQAHLVSGSHDTFIRVWDPATGNCEALLGGHGGTVGALCTVSRQSSSPAHGKADPSGEAEDTKDTLIVSGSGDATVRVWGQAARGTGTGEWACRAVLGGHRHGVWAVHSSPLSGVFASGGGDAAIKLWAPVKIMGEVSTGSKTNENDERTSGEKERQEQTQRWECVGGVRGAAGAVGAILMSKQALVFGTSEALVARFPLKKCMPGQ